VGTMKWTGLLAATAAVAAIAAFAGQKPKEMLLESKAATLKVGLTGGYLLDFHLAGDAVNPLAGMGHFLCLDRWGQPSAAEEKNGVPFHGEASKVEWKVPAVPTRANGGVAATMSADLPLAGLTIQRELWLSDEAAVLRVTESVTNKNKLGRIYNMVQHPTIGPPFLDADTQVDASAGRGFMQSSPLPNPENPEVKWPNALLDGKTVDLRRLTDNPNPNVCSYEVLGKLGWTTAVAPKQQRLIGYLWPKDDYPWFNAWRHVENGKPALRGLEFGTTGLHQPYPVLVKKGRIFDLPLYTYLAVTRTYVAFLAKTPNGFAGVEKVEQFPGALEVSERGGSKRKFRITATAF
jgi:hypothetical protein